MYIIANGSFGHGIIVCCIMKYFNSAFSFCPPVTEMAGYFAFDVPNHSVKFQGLISSASGYTIAKMRVCVSAMEL